MKKILIPTDFSPVADNAAAYAIELSEAFNSKLFLYHVYNMKRSDYDLNFPDKEQPFRKKVKLDMKKTTEKFEEKIANKSLTLNTKIYQGNVLSLFKRTVKKDGIDLIVMGSKGASGIAKVVFGSIAASALEMTEIPLLVVPPEFTFQPLRHIVLAVDNKEVTPEELLPLQKMAVKFGAKVTILRVKTDSDNDTKSQNNVDLGPVETTYSEVLISKDINTSINKFIEKEDCDLLCMVKRKKNFWENSFSKSITKTQVYNNRVPLLILPE